MAYVIKDQEGHPVHYEGKEVLGSDIVGDLAEVKTAGLADYEIEGCASAEVPDLTKEVVEVDGIDFKNFLKTNPILMPAHDLRSWPLGRVTRMWKDTKGGIKRLMFRAKFDEGREAAREVYGLYKRKVLRAFSIGFISEKNEPIKNEDSKSFFTEPRRHIKSYLLEISAVACPANPLATVSEARSLVQQGILSKNFIQDNWCADGQCDLPPYHLKGLPSLQLQDEHTLILDDEVTTKPTSTEHACDMRA